MPSRGRAPNLRGMRVFALILLLATPAVAQTPDPHGAATSIEHRRLRDLLIEHWDHTLERSPRWATELGVHDYDHLLGDRSKEAWEADLAFRADLLARLQSMDPATMAPQDAKAVRLMRRSLRASLDDSVCRQREWSVSPRGNPVVSFARLPEELRLETAQNAQDLVARYRAIPAAIDAEITNLRRGLASDRVATAETVRRTIDQVRSVLETPVDDQPLLKLVGDATLVESTRKKLQPVVRDRILPAYSHYVYVLEREVMPLARPDGQEGLLHLADGKACYASKVRRYTTLDVSPQDLHATGLAELKSIHAEFEALGPNVFGTTDLATIFHRLRTEPSLFFTTEEEVEAFARDALARATAAMDQAFGRLPQAECIVRPIPPHEAPFTTIAYYRGPEPDGRKPGEYFVNTYAPETRPRHEAEVLAFHEAIPGHHLERSLNQELPDVPAYLRYGGYTAFVEGWALYSERLSDELGLYSDDASRMGMLAFDAWRAARLVVDTGIHQFGWSRQQAIDFLTENTPLAINNIDNEVDRYINTPGQALAYKIGQLEILALRKQAEDTLGDRFDIRGFHDTVLAGGAVPLPMLRARVEAWIAAQ